MSETFKNVLRVIFGALFIFYSIWFAIGIVAGCGWGDCKLENLIYILVILNILSLFFFAKMIIKKSNIYFLYIFIILILTFAYGFFVAF